jgi:hypothetical protein
VIWWTWVFKLVNIDETSFRVSVIEAAHKSSVLLGTQERVMAKSGHEKGKLDPGPATTR